MTYDPFAPADPVLKLEKVGDEVVCEITGAYSWVQQTDMKTKEKKTFKNGDPMMQAIIPVTVNGEPFRIFAKNKLLKAIQVAVKKDSAWRHGLGVEAVGAKLKVKRLPDLPPTAPDLSPEKQYEAWFQQPPAGAQQAQPEPATSEAPPF